MDTTLAFCPAEFFGFDSKNCSCRKHWPEFAKRPEVQEGLRRAKQATVCDGPGKDDEGLLRDREPGAVPARRVGRRRHRDLLDALPRLRRDVLIRA